MFIARLIKALQVVNPVLDNHKLEKLHAGEVSQGPLPHQGIQLWALLQELCIETDQLRASCLKAHLLALETQNASARQIARKSAVRFDNSRAFLTLLNQLLRLELAEQLGIPSSCGILIRQGPIVVQKSNDGDLQKWRAIYECMCEPSRIGE